MIIRGKTRGFSVYVTGSDDEDSLLLTATPPVRLVVDIPVQALPWRDLALLERHGRRRPHYGCGDEPDPLLRLRARLDKPYAVTLRTDILGADAIQLADGIATVTVGKEGRLMVPCLRVAEGARMPLMVRTVGPATRKAGVVDVAQLSGGRRVGGARLVMGRPR